MTTKTTVKRSVVSNSRGYKEVSLEFRKARAEALEAAKIHTRTQRIHCPALDASRTGGAYGSKALPSTNQSGLDQWADGLGLSRSAVEGVAYGSGPWYKVLSNKWNQCFDETEVNTGLVKSLKHHVHTGILSTGTFDQDAMNQFVWDILPELKESNTVIDNTFLHSEAAKDLYITSDDLATILEHNKTQSDSCLKTLGVPLSKFEMDKLLLKNLGQKIMMDAKDDNDEKSAMTTSAISVRDLHDLYRYGVFPAPTEDRFLEAGLIQESSIAMSGNNTAN